MNYVGKIKDRNLFYHDDKNGNWIKELPRNPFVLILYSNELNNFDSFNVVVDKCLDNENLAYLCTVGNKSELIHDNFDKHVINRRNPGDILSVWDNDLNESLEFAFKMAFHPDKEVNTLFFVNLDNSSIEDAIKKFIELETGKNSI